MNVGANVQYKRFTKTLNDSGKLVPFDTDIYKLIDDPSKDYYVSLYNYNQSHLEQFKEQGTIKGIKDVTTSRLLFDFDTNAEKNSTFEDARQDTITLVNRLKQYGIQDVSIYFSGGKGFHCEFNTTTTFTPEEFRSTVFSLAEGLKSFDETINNASRIIRVPLTKHNKTGLYKVPLTLDYLQRATEQTIRTHALELETFPEDYELPQTKVNLPESILKFKVKKEEKIKDTVVIKELDLSKKPNWLTSCKYSLSQGHFREGIKHNAFLALAATYRSQGLSEEVVLGMIEGVAKLQAKVNNCKIVPEKNLKRIVDEVFNEFGDGTYTCKKQGWLQNYCNSHGYDCSKGEEEAYPIIETSAGLQKFAKYALDIDKNTIKTGIEDLDKNLNLQIGQLSAMLAPPGIGKSSFALTVLNNSSHENVDSIFFSYDMYSAIMMQKIIQRETGFSRDKVFDIYKNNNTSEISRIDKLTLDNYRNVGFCFKSGQSIEQIKNTIKRREQEIGREVKLIIVDYLELIQSNYSDPTQASSESIQGLREIANEMNKHVLVLLQPNKMNSTPDMPITNYNAAKGSGAISAACAAILTGHRPGYNPREPEKDIFFSLDCVKNRSGPLFSLDYHWHGLTGKIRPLNLEERVELKKLREKKDSEKIEDEF